MQDLIIGLLNHYGYLGIGVLMAVENIFPPIPSEVILTFSGFMTTLTELRIALVVFSATLGSLAGAMALYGIGYMIPIDTLKKLVSGKMGRRLHLSPTDIAKAGVWFASRGGKAVFLCRFIPIVRSLISIPAGTAKMNIGSFLFLTAAGTVLWNTILVTLGVLAGGSWSKIVTATDVYSLVAIGVMGTVFFAFAFKVYRRRAKQR